MDQLRAQTFVGRAAELRYLLDMLDPEATRRVAAITGPGGIGKTELLAAFAREAEARGARVAWVDAGPLPPSEAAFAAVARAALEPDATVLVVDGFEAVAPLESWLRESFLPSLAADLRVVLGGRSQLAAAWRASAAWQSVLATIELGNFDDRVASEYLERRGVSEQRREQIVRVTHGYPLALALFAEIVLRDAAAVPTLDEQPEVVHSLVESLLRGVPDAVYRHALWCAALVRHTTEELLAAMLDTDQATALFDWLRRLPFLRAYADGLVPHDLFRELLEADARCRAPRLRRQLRARAARHYHDDLASNPARAQSTVMDIAFLWREEVPFAGHGVSGLHASTLRASDWPALDAMTLRHQGAAAVRALHLWAERGGEVVVVRDGNDEPQAFSLYLWLERIAVEDAASDPGVAALHRRLTARGELAGMAYQRLLVDKDAHQAPAPSTLVLSAHEFDRFVRNPHLTDGFTAWRDVETALSGLPPGMLERCPEADFATDGHDFHVVRTTARGRNHLEWCIEGLFAPLAEQTDDDEPAAPTLERPAFFAAVRAALRDFHRAERLAENALARSRLINGESSPLRAVDQLRSILREACEALREGDPDDLGYAVLERTFLAGRAKQLRAAAELNLPFGTYRRQLEHATRRVAQWLWLRANTVIQT